MYVLYSLALTVIFVVLLPFFAYKAFTTRKYLANLGERLGNLPSNLSSGGRPTIWIHAVSVGEALAAIPLIRALQSRLGEYRVVVSTTTLTGQAVARSRAVGADAFCYFPFDWSFSVRRTLNTINPSIVILMESELWPNFLRICGEESIPVLVANGRISDRSFRRSRMLSWFTRRIYARVTRFAMQSEADAERARVLGGAADRVVVCGNLKYDFQPPSDCDPRLVEVLSKNRRPLVIAASTVQGEDELVLATFLKVRDALPTRPRLLVAPRHPERFENVADLLSASGLSFLRRSHIRTENSGAPNRNDADPDIILLDSMGELSGTFQFAALVFVGGSLVPKGGHNILEPAAVGRPIVVGPFMENFRAITDSFLERSALVQTTNDSGDPTQELTATWLRILQDEQFALELGNNARAAFEDHSGAAECVTDHVTHLLSQNRSKR